MWLKSIINEHNNPIKKHIVIKDKYFKELFNKALFFMNKKIKNITDKARKK